jgi:hypothetical protein
MPNHLEQKEKKKKKKTPPKYPFQNKTLEVDRNETHT